MRHAAAHRPPLRAALAVALLLGGCEAADYGVTAPEPQNAGGWPELQVRIDVAYQRSVSSAEPSRCQVQVAFVPLTVGEDEDADDSTDDDAQDSPPPTVVASPEEPGTCAFTKLEPGADQGPGPGAAEDDWQVAGAVLGPQAILLEGQRHSLELVAVEVDAGAYRDGGLRYELADCGPETFPFGDVLDLYVPPFEPGGETAGDTGGDALGDTLDGRELLPELFVEDAVMVGAELAMEGPLPGDDGLTEIPSDEGVEITWAFVGPDAELDGVVQRPDVTVKLYNQHHDRDAHGSEWLVCDPDESGRIAVPADTLAAFSLNETAAHDDWTTNIDVHTELATPEWKTPWGEPVQVRAHVSEGAPVRFYE